MNARKSTEKHERARDWRSPGVRRGPGVGGEWRVATVVELQREGVLLVEDGNHGEYRPRPAEFVDEGVAFIRAADMGAGRVLFDAAAKINDHAVRRITKGIGKPGDVLLSHKGTVGKVALVSDDAPPFVCSPQTTFWRALDTTLIDRRYLYAFLRSPDFHAQLATRAGETDMAPYVSLTSQRGLSVTLPPLATQRAIAQFLGALDDKIELNRRMSEALEAMVRALFKSWFVDFDPVRGKADARQRTRSEHVEDVFPKRLVASELGPIPEGWSVRRLGDVLDLEYGKALRAEERRQGDVPVFGANGQVGWHDSSLRRGPGVIVGRKGNPGAVTWTQTDFFAIDTAFFVAPKPCCPSVYFLFHALREQGLGALSADSAVPGLNRNLVYMSKQIIPTIPTLSRFDAVAQRLYLRRHFAEKETLTLTALRDALLPKLLSGELRISDAEKIVEKAV